MEKIIYYPTYDATTHIGDIALIRMNNFKILARNVKPYRIYYGNMNIDSPDIKTGTLYWKPEKKVHHDTPFYTSKQATSFRRDPIKCPFSNELK